MNGRSPRDAVSCDETPVKKVHRAKPTTDPARNVATGRSQVCLVETQSGFQILVLRLGRNWVKASMGPYGDTMTLREERG